MAKLSKSLSFCLIVLLVVSFTAVFLAVKPANAQTVPQPSVPAFTLRFVDNTYDTVATNLITVDPYSGKTTSTNIPSYHVRNYTIQLTITNQEYSTIVNGNTTSLYYDVRLKGHFEDNWTDLFPYSSYTFYSSSPIQSNLQTTVLYFSANRYNAGDQVDFQVQAILGYEYVYYNQDHVIPIGERTFIGAASDWSPTQTFVMPDTSGPNQNLPLIIGAIIAILLSISILLVFYKRHKRTKVVL